MNGFKVGDKVVMNHLDGRRKTRIYGEGVIDKVVGEGYIVKIKGLKFRCKEDELCLRSDAWKPKEKEKKEGNLSESKQ